MKLYKKIICGAAATLLMAGLQSCSEEKATLDGAKTIYIEMTPKDISMSVGDTVYLSATVSNEAGDVIDTPITWSVDDPEVAALVDIVTKKPASSKSRANEAEDPNEGEDNGEGEDTPGDLDPEDPTPTPVDSVEVHRWALIGQHGAQNKTTLVRATLENGHYGVANVSVVARSFNKAVSPITTFIRSYARSMNDTVWFAVNPFQLVDEADIKFEMAVTKQVSSGDEPAEFTNPRVYIDRVNKRVGVVYTGPRIAGLGECRLWVEDGELQSNVATVPIHIYPLIWPGFEVNGIRPSYGPPTPSNIKTTLMTSTMDVNSTFKVGVCLGIDAGADIDIENVIDAEKAGFMTWTIDGSAVVVENTEIDRDYESGYVSYLTLRSGQRTGLSVIKYYMPDTVLTCNLSVDDYNKSFPVDRIIVKQNDEEVDHINFQYGVPANIEVSVEPEASYSFHVPEITVANTSVVEVQPIAEGAGYTRSFTIKGVGTTDVTFTSLDKTLTLPVTVKDRVETIVWDNANVSEMITGTTANLKAVVRMASGAPADQQITWSVSDPELAELTPVSSVGTAGEVTVHALKEGTVKVIASYDFEGVTTTSSYTVNIIAAQDIIVADFAGRGENVEIGDAGDGTFYLAIGDGGEVFAAVPFVEDGVFAGTFSGSDAYMEVNGTPFEDCTYNLTIVDNGDGTYSITGKITMHNGASLVMNGDVFTLAE